MVAVSSSLPVASTTATLQPVRMPGSRPSTVRGRRQQQLPQVAREDADRLALGRFAKPRHELRRDRVRALYAPGPAASLEQPFVRRAAAIGDAGVMRDDADAGMR